jgi:hypothetical protein
MWCTCIIWNFICSLYILTYRPVNNSWNLRLLIHVPLINFLCITYICRLQPGPAYVGYLNSTRHEFFCSPLDCSSCKLGEICRYQGLISLIIFSTLYPGLHTKFAGSIQLSRCTLLGSILWLYAATLYFVLRIVCFHYLVFLPWSSIPVTLFYYH